VKRFCVPLVCVGVVLTAGSAQSSATSARVPSFSTRHQYGAGTLRGRRLSAESVAIGDLNGDGRLDLVTGGSSRSASGVTVLLNRGAGRFGAPRAYPTEWSPDPIAVGDLNGDGVPDLAGAGWEVVSVMINRGDGSFGRGVEYEAKGASDLALGDLNGDDKLDVVVVNEPVNTMWVFLNNGDGTLKKRIAYRTGLEPRAVAIGDLNADDKADVVTTSLADRVSVFSNRGDRTLSKRVEYRTGSGPRSVAIGDLNGDRKPDLVTANTTTVSYGPRPDSVSVFLNRGDGSFRARRDYRAKGDSSFGPMAIGDLNGDGKLDAAIGLASEHLGKAKRSPCSSAAATAASDVGSTTRPDPATFGTSPPAT
jgi:hypothetical protein